MAGGARSLVVVAAMVAWAPEAHAAWPTNPQVNLALPAGISGASGPSLVPDAQGGAYIAFLAPNGPAANQPALVHVTAQGALDPAWPPAGIILGRAVPSAVLAPQAPQLVSDGAHGVLATWFDGACLRVSRITTSGHVAANWPDSGLAACAPDPLSAQAAWAACDDANGGVILGWFDGGNATRSIYAQRVRSSAVLDPGWPVGWTTAHTGSVSVQQPVMASDGFGGAFLVWTDVITNNGNIVAQHVIANGLLHPNWAVNGNTICDASGTQSAAAALPDGEGGMFVAWQDERANPGLPLDDIYLQRMAGSGFPSPGWPVGGRPLCNAAGAQTGVALATDDSGGVFAAWSDARGADRDVYVNRCMLDGNLAAGWPALGLAVCTAAGDQGPVRIVADGRGAAIVTWADARTPANGVPDVYAQRVLRGALVDPAWTVNGVALSTAPGGQSLVAAIPDGGGGAIAAWADTRGAQPAVYAQRVANVGTLGGDVVVGVPPAPPGAGLALGAAPNPAFDRMRFRFTQLVPGRVDLAVYDVRGRRMAVVTSGDFGAGEHDVPWNVHGLGAGVYLARLHTARGDAARRIVVLGSAQGFRYR